MIPLPWELLYFGGIARQPSASFLVPPPQEADTKLPSSAQDDLHPPTSESELELTERKASAPGDLGAIPEEEQDTMEQGEGGTAPPMGLPVTAQVVVNLRSRLAEIRETSYHERQRPVLFRDESIRHITLEPQRPSLLGTRRRSKYFRNR